MVVGFVVRVRLFPPFSADLAVAVIIIITSHTANRESTTSPTSHLIFHKAMASTKAATCFIISQLFVPASTSTFVLSPQPSGSSVLLPKIKYYDKPNPIKEIRIYSKHRDLLHTSFTTFNDNVSLRGGFTLPRITVPSLAFASIMSFLSGCSDALCLQRFRCYTTMMTGNIIMMSIAVAEKNWLEALWKSSLISCFFVGATFARSIEWICQKGDLVKSSSTRGHLRCIAPIIFSLFALFDRLGSNQRWKLSVLTIGYGMVYSSANQALDATITQLMTGHVTKLGFAVSDRVMGQHESWNKGTLMSLCIVSSFVVGVMFGVMVSGSSFVKEGPLFTLLGFIYATCLLCINSLY